MMYIFQKNLKIIIALSIFFIFSLQIVFSCAAPPDILHEFRLNIAENNNKNLTISYTLSAWPNLKNQVRKNLEQASKKTMNSENLEEIIEREIIQNSKIFIDEKLIHLYFLSGSIRENLPAIADENGEYGYLPDEVLSAEFSTNFLLDTSKFHTVRLEFNKTPLLSISPLIHPFLSADFQKNLSSGYVVNKSESAFDVYKCDNNAVFVAKNAINEWETINTFTLSFGPKTDDYADPNAKFSNLIDNTKNYSVSTTTQNNTKNFNVFRVGETLQGFFSQNNSLFVKILWIFIAFVVGAMHGLLPGHAKSLLSAYIISAWKPRKKEIFALIFSVTFSHTIFIFLLAIIILALQKWIGASTKYISQIAMIWYLLFGLYFIQKWFFLLKNLKNLWQKNIFSIQKTLEMHNENCNCAIHKNSLKKTTFAGILAGMNPCIDALALFIFSITIGNISYAILIILAFSLGLGAMLGWLTSMMQKGKKILEKKSQYFAEKFTAWLVTFIGIALVISSIWYFL